MKHHITPEQFSANEDAPSAIIEAPFKFIRMPYNAEAGGYATVAMPDNWDGKIAARVRFVRNGVATSMGASVACNGHPQSPTNSAQASVAADVTGASDGIILSNIAEMDCSALSGHTISVKVSPDLSTTTEDEPIDIALVELFIGTY